MFVFQVRRKKQKSRKVKEEKMMKDKKRSKEKKKQKEENMVKGKEKKRKKVEQRLNKVLPVSSIKITSKSRNNTRSKQDFFSGITSSSTAGMVSRMNNERAHRILLNVTENNFNNSGAVSNEINGAKLSTVLHPPLHISEINEHQKPDMEKTMNNNKIPLIQITKAKTLFEGSSASEFGIRQEDGIKEKERKSERHKMLTEESSLTKSSSISTGSSDIENQLPNGTGQDSKIKEKHHVELYYPSIFELSNSTREGDRPCLSGIFIPAPHVANAKIKYIW
jgi:hypothetical protein